jgi:NADH:ubiquinone reductase (H+-translocating)
VAGNHAAPIGKSLGAPIDSAGCLRVNNDLFVPGYPEIFAVADLVCFKDEAGKDLPGVSP